MGSFSEQIYEMQYLIEKALTGGRYLWTIIWIRICPYSSLEEIYAISIIAAKHNRPITIHIRIFSDHDLNSLR